MVVAAMVAAARKTAASERAKEGQDAVTREEWRGGKERMGKVGYK